MKKVLLLALTMLLASKTSLAIVNNPDKYGNTSPIKTTAQVQDISLDGKWRFIADSTDYSQGLPANVQTVTVPHTYNVMPGLEEYAGRTWYERSLPITKAMKGHQLRLQFEAVYHDATVYT